MNKPKTQTTTERLQRIFYQGEYIKAVCRNYPELVEPLRAFLGKAFYMTEEEIGFLERIRILKAVDEYGRFSLSWFVSYFAGSPDDPAIRDWPASVQNLDFFPLASSDAQPIERLPREAAFLLNEDLPVPRTYYFNNGEPYYDYPPPRYNPAIQSRDEYLEVVQRYIDVTERIYIAAGFKPSVDLRQLEAHMDWLSYHLIEGKTYNQIALKVENRDSKSVETAVRRVKQLIGLPSLRGRPKKS